MVEKIKAIIQTQNLLTLPLGVTSDKECHLKEEEGICEILVSIEFLWQ